MGNSVPLFCSRARGPTVCLKHTLEDKETMLMTVPGLGDTLRGPLRKDRTIPSAEQEARGPVWGMIWSQAGLG